MVKMQAYAAVALFSYMPGNAVDICHYLSRVFENVCIYYLEKVAFYISVGLDIVHLEGLVDVSVCNGVI